MKKLELYYNKENDCLQFVENGVLKYHDEGNGDNTIHCYLDLGNVKTLEDINVEIIAKDYECLPKEFERWANEQERKAYYDNVKKQEIQGELIFEGYYTTKKELYDRLIPLVSNELIECLGKGINVKLYDILYNTDEHDYELYFNRYCEMEFGDFESYLEEEELERQYLGRTSTFYILPKSKIKDYYSNDEYRKAKDVDEKRIMFIDDFFNIEYNMYDIINMEDNDIIEPFGGEDDVEAYFKDYVDLLKKVKGAYDYVQNVKDNQIQYWNEFLKAMKED